MKNQITIILTINNVIIVVCMKFNLSIVNLKIFGKQKKYRIIALKLLKSKKLIKNKKIAILILKKNKGGYFLWKKIKELIVQ